MEIPGYEIKESIGEGGSSEVFRAIRLDGHQTVALKLLHQKYSEDPGMRKRLLREADVIRKLAHNNVVRIYRSGTIDDRIYMILQYLDRGSLSDFKKYELRRLLMIMIQVCDGVEYIHARGIVHRDLKPSNIMFGADGIPCLVDFGISLFTQEEYTRLTHTNMVMGTLSYMSPEQQSNPGAVDKRTDIYALGAILYEIFTGLKPVGRFQNPTRVVPGFDKRLETIILKAMAYNMDERYPEVSLLKQELIELWRSGLFAEEGEPFIENFDVRVSYWLRQLDRGTMSQRLEARKKILENVVPDDLDQLLSICASSDRETRGALIPALGRLKRREAAPFLRGLIGDPVLSKDACYALVELGDKESADRMAVLAKKREVFSYNCLVPMALLSGDKHLKFVFPYLKSKSFAERDAALKALEHAAGRKQVKDLKKFIKSEKETDLRNRAYMLVQRLELS